MESPIAVTDLTNEELATIYSHRAALDQREQGRPAADPPPIYRRRAPPQEPKASVAQRLFAIGMWVLLVVMIATFAVMLLAALGIPLPNLPNLPQRSADTPAPDGAQAPMHVAPPAAPAVVPVGVVAVPEEPRLYDLVVPEHMRGAWTRHGAAELDVSGLRYALLLTDGDAQLVELDNPDHNQVWLLAAPAAPVVAEIVPAAPLAPLVDKQDMGVPSAQGSGGTLWDTPLPTPPDATPLPTPRPTAPLTFDPAHAGPGGSSGGSTWGQP